MGEWVKLRADDGVELGAWVARPEGEPVAGLVVVQEIFGVNAHIRRVTEGWAKDGFIAVAPALFDRVEPGVELGYEGADAERARSFIPKLSFEKSLLDTKAAMDYARKVSGEKVGVIGYCYGGTIAWLAAAGLGADTAVGYYGGRIGNYAHERPGCPVMLHFGRQDAHIPPEEIDKVRGAHPEVEIYMYDAGHGFNCDARSAYNAAAAGEARGRSLEFLKRWMVDIGTEVAR